MSFWSITGLQISLHDRTKCRQHSKCEECHKELAQSKQYSNPIFKLVSSESSKSTGNLPGYSAYVRWYTHLSTHTFESFESDIYSIIHYSPIFLTFFCLSREMENALDQ